jgi:hypothetical protein
METSNNENQKSNVNENLALPDVEWTTDHEKILIEWADKAMCYRWLHSKSNALYHTRNTWYTIPVIVISTLTGTANFAQTRVPAEYQNYYAMVVGGFNIIAGIITTVQQFLKITQLNEAHRVSSIAWDKFYRNIKIELAKHPKERIHVSHMLKICKEEFDRLMETSPNIPEKIVHQFSNSFKKSKEFQEIFKPEICDVLVSTDKFRNEWFSDENQNKLKQELAERNNKSKEKEQLVKQTRYNLVKEFKTQFYSINNREPLDTEIITNLKDEMDLETLRIIIDDLRTDPIDNV